MVLFKSLIIFDLETSGLPHLEHNDTRIVELAFLGCEIEHLKKEEFPRVLQKLVLCFNPNKKIQPGASNASGLDNDLVQNCDTFTKEDSTVLNRFISRLPAPVCLVAHNGYKFDFPILRRQLDKLKVNLPNNVYCADSLIAFRQIYPQPVQKTTPIEKNLTQIRENGTLAEGEKTPKRQKTVSTNIFPKKSNEINYKGEINSDVKKNLFPDSEPKPEVEDYTETQNSSQVVSAPLNYSQKCIYYFLHNKNFPDAHRAEEDCKALLSCIMKCDSFLEWVNENAITFNSVEPLW